MFDEKWYKMKYLSRNYRGSVVDHYLEFGAKKGFNPNRLFDREWYLKEYPEVKLSGIDPFIHYVKYGFKEKRNINANS